MSEPYITYEVARNDDNTVFVDDDESVYIHVTWDWGKYAQPVVQIYESPFETAENMAVMIAQAMRVNLPETP